MSIISSLLSKFVPSTQAPDQTANRVQMLTELFGIEKNKRFNTGFMSLWNSGSGSRDHECYSRHLRQSLGLDHYYQKKEIIVTPKTNPYYIITDYLKEKGWQFLLKSEDVLWFIHIEDNVPIIYGEVIIEERQMKIACEGDEATIREMMADLSKLYVENGIQLDTMTGIGQNGPIISSSYLFPDTEKLSFDSFYPWMEHDHKMHMNEVIDDYLNSPHTNLLLIGPPGTGKSTMIRTIFARASRKHNYLVTSQQALMDPSFPAWLASRPSGSIVAIEDADTLVESREKGNYQMASLLQTADGVVQNGIKIIISTNLPSLKDVDTALTRPGRCHRVIRFDMLNADEAMKAREEVGLPEVEIEDGEYTLSEALNYETLEGLRERKKATRAGFI